MYAITATVTRIIKSGWHVETQIPTFYLDANVQGIVDEDHATRIATDVLTAMLPATSEGDGTLHITAVKVNANLYCRTHDVFGCWFNHS